MRGKTQFNEQYINNGKLKNGTVDKLLMCEFLYLLPPKWKINSQIFFPVEKTKQGPILQNY